MALDADGLERGQQFIGIGFTGNDGGKTGWRGNGAGVNATGASAFLWSKQSEGNSGHHFPNFFLRVIAGFGRGQMDRAR